MIITNTYLNNDQVVGRLGNKMFIIASILGSSKYFGNDKDAIFPRWKYEFIFKNKLNYYEVEPEINFVYKEPHFHYTPIIINQQGNYNILGYFQSWKYFDHIHDDIVHYFEPSDLIIEEIMDKYSSLVELNNTTSIHIRRGDYIGDEGHHPSITKKYIINAMKEMGDSKFVFFSDDIEWCKESFGSLKTKDLKFVSDKDYIDLFLMSMMKNNIIANSSFSWWSAYLNKNGYKKIIYPEPWFGKLYDHDTKDLSPENWKQIKCY